MIIGFVGRMGSGKTLSMTRELARYHARGYRIITNYELNFQDEAIDFDRLFDMAQNDEVLDNVVIALDEVHILLDSRSSMSATSKIMSFWLNQTRKQKIVLMYTTQYMHQVDKRLRSGTDIIVFCDGILVEKDGEKLFVCYNEFESSEGLKSDVFVGNPFYQFYDTYKVIKFTKD